LVAIRFKDHLGQTAEMLAEFVSVTPAQVQVIDRRKVKALLKAGLNPNFAMFLSTNKFGSGSISGIARLKPTVSIEDSRDHAEDET